MKTIKPVINISDVNLEDKVNPQPIHNDQVYGKMKLVSAAPTEPPRNTYEQLVIYSNGATTRLYLYDDTNGWKYKTIDNT